jgi:xanthine/uracil permease
MSKPEHYGQAALVGWRKAVADVTAPRVASHGPLSEDQVRAAIGGVLFAASFYYVVSTIVRLMRTARD